MLQDFWTASPLAKVLFCFSLFMETFCVEKVHLSPRRRRRYFGRWGGKADLPPLRGLQKCGVASPRVVYLCACGAVERRRVGRWVAPGRDRVTWGKWRLLRAKKIPAALQQPGQTGRKIK